MTRWPRPMAAIAAVAILAGLGGIVVGVVQLQSATPASGDGQIACVDVAADVGLRFRGDYGPVPPGSAYSVESERNMGNGAAAGDYDGDGWLDVYLLGQAGHRSRLFHNESGRSGGRVFRDVTVEAGLGDQTGLSRVAHFADLTGTGRLDLIVVNDAVRDSDMVPSKVYRNNGDGTFTDVTAGSGFDPTGYIVGGVSLADYDASGLPSIYVSYWLQGETGVSAGDPGLGEIKATFPGSNVLYRNLGDYRFEAVTQSSGLAQFRLARDTFSSVFADFTGDGRPDLYQAVDHAADLFFQNAGDGTFVNRTDQVGLGHRIGNSMGIAAADLANDGSLDLYITNITDPSGGVGVNLGNTLMLSQGLADNLRFANAAKERGVLDTGWGWGTSFVDLNLDGTRDLFAVQGYREMLAARGSPLAGQSARLFLNDGTDHFNVARNTGCDVTGDQRALLVLDYNRDGLPDMLVTQVDGPVRLLENRSQHHGHWLTVIPEGPGAATVNAVVAVTVAGRTSTETLLAGGSYLAGPPREAYVGLGAAQAAEQVTVTWSNGRRVTERDVRADQVLRIAMPPG